MFSGLFLADKLFVEAKHRINCSSSTIFKKTRKTPDQLDSIQNSLKMLQANLSDEAQGLVSKAMSLTEEIRKTAAQGEDAQLTININIKIHIIIIVLILL